MSIENKDPNIDLGSSATPVREKETRDEELDTPMNHISPSRNKDLSSFSPRVDKEPNRQVIGSRYEGYNKEGTVISLKDGERKWKTGPRQVIIGQSAGALIKTSDTGNLHISPRQFLRIGKV